MLVVCIVGTSSGNRKAMLTSTVGITALTVMGLVVTVLAVLVEIVVMLVLALLLVVVAILVIVLLAVLVVMATGVLLVALVVLAVLVVMVPPRFDVGDPLALVLIRETASVLVPTLVISDEFGLLRNVTESLPLSCGLV